MNPYRVHSTKMLPLIPSKGLEERFVLMPAAKPVSIKATNEVAIKRSILHAITLSNLRGAVVFEFEQGSTTLRVFETAEHPLTEHEVKGGLIHSIKQVHRLNSDDLIPIRQRYYPKRPHIQALRERLTSYSVTDQVYIILIFDRFIMATGNAFDETTFCRTLMDFRPRLSRPVIRRMDKGSVSSFLYYDKEDFFEPRVKVFSHAD